jgi:uncharacterized repeat protein (TIGR03803 family)
MRMRSGLRQPGSPTGVSVRLIGVALFGLAVLLPSMVFAQELPMTTILRFDGSDGANPYGGLVEDDTGALYGTATSGGSGNGVVFELLPSSADEAVRKIKVLHSFTGNGDGNDPLDSVTLFKGALYGTTFVGGSGKNGCYADGLGCGTVFKLAPPAGTGKKWTYTVLHRFSSKQADNDGAMPGGYGNGGGVYVNSSGTLYGTTSQGGGTSCTVPGTGCGVFYSIAGGVYSILYRFQGGSDANAPAGTLVPGPGGELYGVSYFGGNTGSSCVWGSFGCGTVFEVDASGSETVLYRFSGGADGSNPSSSLAFDSAGNIYGTTVGGGASNLGTVFVLTKKSGWSEQVIHSFAGGKDGTVPQAPLSIIGGEVFGTTPDGGGVGCSTNGGANAGCGVAFVLDPPLPGETAWTETILHRFSGGQDGGGSVSGLVAGTDGLYGTSLVGGSSGDGNNTGKGTAFLLFAGPGAHCGTCGHTNP